MYTDTRERELERRLLAVGGTRVLLAGVHHRDELLERGRQFDTKRRSAGRGRVKYRGHHVAALRYLRHFALALPGNCEIVTGLALHDNALWVPHSWNWTGNRIIDANPEFAAYYGVLLSPEEASQFAIDMLVPTLPGFTAAKVAKMQNAARRTAALRAG
jgi:hypothetical protein